MSIPKVPPRQDQQPVWPGLPSRILFRSDATGRLRQSWAEYLCDGRETLLAPHRDLRLELDGVEFIDLPDGSRFGVGIVRIWELDPPRQAADPEPDAPHLNREARHE